MKSIKLLHKLGLIIMKGPLKQVKEHRHHVLQIVFDLSEHCNPDEIRLTVEGEELNCTCLIIAPDTAHSVNIDNGLIFLIEAESHLAKNIKEKYLDKNNFCCLSEKIVSELFSIQSIELSDEFNWEFVESFLKVLDENICLRRQLQPRLQKLISWFDEIESNGNWQDVSLAAALDLIHLSESRFLHLFVEEFEITWRRYILWRRLLAAIKYALGNQSLTTSAQHAGFSDSAHLSRVFKEMFGLSPKSIVSSIQSIN